MLEVNGISKLYGAKMAIENISFSAERGQVIGLLGHNGCGKSTIMSIITNCLVPSSGDVLVDGISVSSFSLKTKQKIGYLPEIPPVYSDMTVEEQLNFACGLRNIDKGCREKEIARACEDLNITGVRKRLIRNLSKGYRQRVGFAQALIGRPPLLILDEPMVGLDPQQIIELRELIIRLKQNHTVILSSHILSEIAVTCDRIVILSNGHLVADDTLERLVARTSGRNRFILQADGSVPEILSLLQIIPGVVECNTYVSQINGELEYHIDMDQDGDVLKDLFQAMAENGHVIRLLKPIQASLEEIFLDLTQDRRYEQ